MKLIKRTMEDVCDLFLSLNMVHTTSTAKVDIHQFEDGNQGCRYHVAVYEGPLAHVRTFVPVMNCCCSPSMQEDNLTLVPIGGRLYVVTTGNEGYEVSLDSTVELETKKEKLTQRAAALRTELAETERAMQRLSNSAGLAPGDHFTFVCLLKNGTPSDDASWVGQYLTVANTKDDGGIEFDAGYGLCAFIARHKQNCILKPLSAPLPTKESEAMYWAAKNRTVKI